MRLTSAERNRLAAGAPVTKLLDADEGKEVAVFGAVVADLRTCRVGDCQVKLGEKALQRFRTGVDWKVPRPPSMP